MMMMILHYRENNNFSSPLMSSKSRIYVTYNERILVEFIYILCFSSSLVLFLSLTIAFSKRMKYYERYRKIKCPTKVLVV